MLPSRGRCSSQAAYFLEQLRRKSQGMVGLAIVLAYVLVAVFARFWPIRSMNDLYLADMLARLHGCPN